jgi:molybdate transport system substrate-binding protein
MRVLNIACCSLVMLLVIACSSAATPVPPTTNVISPSPTSAPAATDTPLAPTQSANLLSGELIVFAASSLTDAFNEMAAAFQTQYPDINVVFNFAGTPTLRTQLEQGAEADVFASANEPQMELALQSEVVEGTPTAFATNRLVVVTPAGRESVQILSDLEKPGVKIVLALPDVPVGEYSRQSLQQMDASGEFPAGFASPVLSNVVSEETNVRQVLAKVALGEADAGIAYRTDVTPDVMDKVRTIDIPDEFNVLAVYLIAQVKDAPNAAGATAFIEFVLSAESQDILAQHGFGGTLQ